ncbi:MAG: magnesium-translocating P-type ATPase [Eubacteriales bacterium]|nr:magnesium-translocating P-type ATPase [Eubacteriales bacterium]
MALEKHQITKDELTRSALHRPAEAPKVVQERLIHAAQHEADDVMAKLGTTINGLSNDQVDEMRKKYGDNVVIQGKKQSIAERLYAAFINPFTLILIVLAIVSALTDIIFAAPEEQSYITVILISAMVLMSGILRFIQELRSGNAADRLTNMIVNTSAIIRQEDGEEERIMEEAVVGDIIRLAAGDMIPADLRIISAKDLFISQSALTGESDHVEKFGAVSELDSKNVLDYENLAFMGTNVISGSAIGLVLATGQDTIFGQIAESINKKPEPTSFERGVNHVSRVLIRFMLIMVPIVFLLTGITKGNWLQAGLFAISIAVGLTPEMLPMIVTTSLAKGAVHMSKEKVIIKNLNSIQNLGSIDILCTDKTGTITQDKVALEYHLDLNGKENAAVLKHAYLNSFFQTGLKNLMDRAIIERTHEEAEIESSLENLRERYIKVDEVPFDFERRRMSVVVKDLDGKTQMITKGALEEMLRICSFVQIGDEVLPLDAAMDKRVRADVDRYNDKGLRVLLVAQKTNPSPVGVFSVKDEAEMVLIGYLAFLDPPKTTTADAITALHEHGVEVKVLTGDNERVSRAICKMVGLDVSQILTGDDIEEMDDATLTREAQRTTVFARLSPLQKSRIVKLMKADGHSVGYMGDGINDVPALKDSDVGISVDTAVDIAKESSDVILLEKDLMVLERGIIEGRKTYANMIKYIKMTASSNFGNVFSMLVAAAFLPFLPMTAIQILVLNLIYDITCSALPWDNVDPEYIMKPRTWDADSISRFMVWIGPTSSVFDIITYAALYFFICPAMVGASFHNLQSPAQIALFIAIFQAGWFVTSMWTQTLVIHMIRTPKLPFIESRSSLPVMFLTTLGIAVLTYLPFSPLANLLNLAPLSWPFFALLFAVVLGYMFLVSVVKHYYIKRHNSWL